MLTVTHGEEQEATGGAGTSAGTSTAQGENADVGGVHVWLKAPLLPSALELL